MNARKEYIAYLGDVYQIEFYFDEKGKSQSRDYMLAMSPGDTRKLAHLLRLMGDHGELMNVEKFRNEGEGIYAFKPQPHRFLCFFFEGNKIILTNAFWKKEQKLPRSEKVKALQCMEDYKHRVQKGKYYGGTHQE